MDATANVPNTCGVYALFAKGRLWYIGKAVRCRRRFHHSIHPIRILLGKFSVVQVAFKSCNSEIDALKIEDRLIKRLRPPMNGPARSDLFDGYE